jgi:hypothetical protein
MKTFKDLEFEEHENHGEGKHAVITFDNGYGASVICTPYSYGGKVGLYEVGILGQDGHLTYDTPITDDVMGYLTEQGVTNVMKEIQTLKNKTMKAENKFRETNNDTFSDAMSAGIVTGLISILALVIAIMSVKLAFAFLLVAIIYILSIIRYKQQRDN